MPTVFDTKSIRRLLSDENDRATELRSWGVSDLRRGASNLATIAAQGIPDDLMAAIGTQLSRLLPETSDPGMALNNLERFVCASRSPLSLGALFDRDRTALPILLRLFSTSQHLSDLLVREPEGYDLLRITEGRPVARKKLLDEIAAEVSQLSDERHAMAALRRYKHRETLRIAYGDLVGRQRLDVVARQISYLADALVNAAVLFAISQRQSKWGTPHSRDGRAARFSILGLGKLGGNELNYSSDIDLIPFYDEEGETRGGARSVSNREFYSRVVGDVVKLLGEVTDLGAVYRVDLRLRPEGSAGPVVRSLDAMLRYYDTAGRTWERQAFVKARAVAGDEALSDELLSRLQSWIYRNYLSRADISGIKALKRRIEQRATAVGTLDPQLTGSSNTETPLSRDVKCGLGGIRDIEFCIQFLQLLNGGDLPSIRSGPTLEAISLLAQAGCLTLQESHLLTENYEFLRTVEHRLQIMFDRRTHELPSDGVELRKLAIRMGFVDSKTSLAVDEFLISFRKRTETNRKMLNFLLHDAFPDEATHPEADLVLDPEPPVERIDAVLSRYGFADPQIAYRVLVSLGQERVAFLSTRRCRHFLAAIAPTLLQALKQTPDPDRTLVTLAQVADSIGGKGVLWELMSFHKPSLDLLVRLSASGDYLSGMLIRQPGMIDELLDSLLLERLPAGDALKESLRELSRGAEDIDPILHSFKSSHHLSVGVRDLLGRSDIEETHRSLADLSDALVEQVVQWEQAALEEKLGVPMLASSKPYRRCEFVTLALGKWGGREPNYHSDLDLVFLYEGDGETQAARGKASTSNQHYFTQLAHRIVKRLSQVTPYGRLYEVDARLRPTGRSGSLVVSFSEFARYFAQGSGELWERLALVKARPVTGSDLVCAEAMKLVKQTLLSRRWQASDAREIAAMRMKLQETASSRNLKRGSGGTMDVEFACQMLQLCYDQAHPSILVPGTLEALACMAEAGILESTEAQAWSDDYRRLRTVESRLRLMNTAARHDLPDDSAEIARLSYVLREPEEAAVSRSLEHRLERTRSEIRERFLRLVERLARS